MLSDPLLSNAALARKLDLSEPWVSTIKNTDLFQEEFRKRLTEHRAQVSERIIAKTETVVDLTLDRMKGILADPDQEIALGRLGQIYDITSKRLFPDPGRAGQSTVVNIALADSDAIRRARERAERLRTTDYEPELLDVSPEPAT